MMIDEYSKVIWKFFCIKEKRDWRFKIYNSIQAILDTSNIPTILNKDKWNSRMALFLAEIFFCLKGVNIAFWLNSNSTFSLHVEILRGNSSRPNK